MTQRGLKISLGELAPAGIEKIVEMVRLNLYNKGLFCANQAIQWKLIDMGVQPVSSPSTIGRILRRRESKKKARAFSGCDPD